MYEYFMDDAVPLYLLLEGELYIEMKTYSAW